MRFDFCVPANLPGRRSGIRAFALQLICAEGGNVLLGKGTSDFRVCRKKSGGETAMAVDSAAGTLIKGRFSPGAEKCELFVSELLGDKDKVGGLAADIFRLALGFHDCVKSRELRVHSVDGKPQFARTENVGVEFSDYTTKNGVYLPRVLKIESGFLRIDLRLASSKIGGLK